MKYLVNRETKEHIRFDDRYSVPLPGWDIVEADAEGWIKWEGGECPLPENYPVALKFKGRNFKYTNHLAGDWAWEDKTIEAYRPILDKPEEYPPQETAQAGVGVNERSTDDLISRLKSAHDAAQTIPDLLTELREVLGSMGYDLVARSPFVERAETPLPDMSDWRNWREGDLVTIQTEPCYDWWTLHKPYDVRRDADDNLVVVADDGDEYPIDGEMLRPGRFRFHSRPEVKS